MVIDLISKTVKKLIFTEPFYGLFMIGLNKKVSDKIPTAGVGPVSYTHLTLPTNREV